MYDGGLQPGCMGLQAGCRQAAGRLQAAAARPLRLGSPGLTLATILCGDPHHDPPKATGIGGGEGAPEGAQRGTTREAPPERHRASVAVSRHQSAAAASSSALLLGSHAARALLPRPEGQPWASSPGQAALGKQPGAVGGPLGRLWGDGRPHGRLRAYPIQGAAAQAHEPSLAGARALLPHEHFHGEHYGEHHGEHYATPGGTTAPCGASGLGCCPGTRA